MIDDIIELVGVAAPAHPPVARQRGKCERCPLPNMDDRPVFRAYEPNRYGGMTEVWVCDNCLGKLLRKVSL